jgi:hypothetical protein
VKADRLQKHKGEGRESRLACRFPVVLPAILTARLRHERVTKADRAETLRRFLTRRHVEFVLQRDLLEVGHQGLDAHMPAAEIWQRHVAQMPIAVSAERGLAFQRFDATLGQSQNQCGLLVRSGLPSADISCSTKLSAPTLPGEIST